MMNICGTKIIIITELVEETVIKFAPEESSIRIPMRVSKKLSVTRLFLIFSGFYRILKVIVNGVMTFEHL